MASGYGIYSTTTYSANTDNMAIATADILGTLIDRRPTLLREVPTYWTVPLVFSDTYEQIDNIDIHGATARTTLYWKILSSVLYIYSDSDMSALVAQSNGDTIEEQNSSGYSGTWTAPDTYTDDAGSMRVTTPEAELQYLQSRVFGEIAEALLQSPNNPADKLEYLRRLADNTQLIDAEANCYLYLFYKMQRDGNVDDTETTLEQQYKTDMISALGKAILWDNSITVTEDDTDEDSVRGGYMLNCGGGW